MSSLDLAVVGNSSFGALIDGRGRVVWACLPRFDGDPVFCSLLGGTGEPEAGFWDVELIGFDRAEQGYRPNSAVLWTRLHDRDGGIVEIVDFAPRFKQFGRVFRPIMLVRRLARLAGAPRVRIRLRPVADWGAVRPVTTRGSNHIRYVMHDFTVRLTTDAPITYIHDEAAFLLENPVNLMLGPDESFASPVAEISREFEERTHGYWREWCRYLALPFEWQDAVIRAAITLKLSNFEDTGAIIAAMTTSIPEAPDSGRTWDYRFCWLRDSYFVVRALNRLGVTRMMEGFLGYVANIVAAASDGYLQPVFGIGLENRLDERIVTTLPGYRGMGPVRAGNGAYTQVQNDGYGSVVLASAQCFFDARLERRGDLTLFGRLEHLGEQAAARWNQPDAGPWELRTRQGVHTYCGVMCWAACDRLARIAARLGLNEREAHWHARADEIHAGIVAAAWNEDLKSFTASFGGDDVDASLLLLPELGFVAAGDKRFRGTLALVEKRLRNGGTLFRYARADDFGVPRTAFTVCTFWYIDALAAVGRTEEARDLFEGVLARRNPAGLLSEGMTPSGGELWGNFPQTYSMVGLIHAATRLSRPWERAF